MAGSTSVVGRSSADMSAMETTESTAFSINTKRKQ